MKTFIESYINFIGLIKWNLVFIALLMFAVVVLIVYVMFTMITSIQYRREALKVSLPDIESVGKKVAPKPQFAKKEVLEVELLDPDYDFVIEDDKVGRVDLFDEALSRETGKYIPSSKDNGFKLPDVKPLVEEDEDEVEDVQSDEYVEEIEHLEDTNEEDIQIEDLEDKEVRGDE